MMVRVSSSGLGAAKGEREGGINQRSWRNMRSECMAETGGFGTVPVLVLRSTSE
jgi:hypothetical protein